MDKVQKLKDQDIRTVFGSPLNLEKVHPVCTSTPVNGSRKRKLPSEDPKQLIIDAGQKNVGMTNCLQCGMVYSVDVPRDKQAHNEYHNRFTQTKFFRVDNRNLNSWKSKAYHEVIAGKINGVIFQVNSKPRSTLKTRFENVIKELVDPQIGICDDVPVFSLDKSQIGYLFVVDGTTKDPSFIGGVVLTERVPVAKLMPRAKIYKDDHPKHGFISIERLWIHPSIRRQKIASKMLDVVRRLYSSDLQLLRTRIAFVEPNPVCIEFAKAFLSEKNKNQYIIYDPEDLTKNPDDISEKKKFSTQGTRNKILDKENQPSPKRIKVEKNTYELKESKKNIIKQNLEEIKEQIPTVVINNDDERNLELSDELF